MGREGEWKDGKGKGEHGKKRAGMESGGGECYLSMSPEFFVTPLAIRS